MPLVNTKWRSCKFVIIRINQFLDFKQREKVPLIHGFVYISNSVLTAYNPGLLSESYRRKFMKKTGAILLGLLAIEPALYVVFFMLFIFSHFLTMSIGTDTFENIKYIFPFHFLTMILSVGMMIYFAIHALQSKLIESDKRIIWVLVLFFGNIYALPIYWFFFVFKPAFGLSSSLHHQSTLQSQP